MRRPDQIRLIYSELRRSLGHEVPGHELIKLAFHLLRAYSSEEFEKLGQPGRSPSLVSLPVDEAMRDGGWRVLEFENENSASFLDDNDVESREARRSLIERFLGPEWQHHPLMGQLSP